MIIEIESLGTVDVSELDGEARNEGYNIVNHLITDYASGINRFGNKGEKLIGYTMGNEIVAVCGLSIEPTNNKIGRIRRLYVLPRFRHIGIGSKLVRCLIEHAKGHFKAVVVNIGDLPIDNFYNSIGFRTVNSDSYTHILEW